MCDVRLSTNHKYVGINLLQQFIGFRIDSATLFIRSSRQYFVGASTKEIQNKNDIAKINPSFPGIPWSQGTRVDKNPVEYFIVSNNGVTGQ